MAYLSERDVLRLQWGVEQVRRICSEAPLASLLLGEASPGADKTGNQLSSWIPQNAFPNSHWVGSLRMGPGDTSDASFMADSVLDNNFKVRGVDSLYVSGMTRLSCANLFIQSAIVTIASIQTPR